ncbi:MAG: PQQ-binding-like beta-propeller repeat protein [Verrucomicrobia bacterium]|nr:PQQ-binding-like beta-propeller repeat protein [Verrucomicrobiota bacterium]
MTKTGYARFVLTLLFAALSFHDPLRAAESTETLASSPDSDWPMFKHDLKRTGFSPSTAPNSPALVWKTDIGRWGKFWSSACVADGKLYIGGNDGNLYCLDAGTGEHLWTYFTDTGQPIFSSPVFAKNRVYFAGYERLYAIPATGPSGDSGEPDDRVWTFRFGKSTGGVNDVVAGSPAIRDGRLFIGAVDQFFYCFDAGKGGSPLWETRTPYRGQHAFASSPALDRGKVFAATGNQSGSGRLYCFDEAKGTILWEFDIDDITYSSPVIDGDRVFIANSGDWIGGNHRYRLYCLDVNGFLDGVDSGVADDHMGNADLIWSHDTTDYVYSSPSVHDGRLFFGCANGTLTCLDAEEGNPVWTYRSSARRRFAQPRGILSSPALADGKVFVTVEGDLLALPETDPNGDGAISPNEVLWSYEIGGDGVCSPVVANGFVYVGNHRGTVYCFGPKH